MTTTLGPIVVEEVEHRELHHHRRSAQRFGRRDWIREGLPEIFKINHAAHCRISASIARVVGQRMGAVCGLVCDMPWPLRPLGVRELFEPGKWKRPDFSGLLLLVRKRGFEPRPDCSD
jgi:hypothetical protein